MTPAEQQLKELHEAAENLSPEDVRYVEDRVAEIPALFRAKLEELRSGTAGNGVAAD